MALEDIVFPNIYRGYKQFKDSREILEDLHKDPYNPGVIKDLSKYFMKYNSKSKDEANSLSEQLIQNPEVTRKVIEGSAINTQNELVKLASENYEEILDELPKDKLVALALEMPDKEKKYLDVIKSHNSGDTEGLRKVLADAYQNPIWKDFAKGAILEILGKYIPIYIKDAQNKFITNRLAAGEIKEYMTDRIKDIEDDEDLEGEDIRKKRNPIYLKTAETYYKNEKKKIDDDEDDETDEKREAEMAKPDEELIMPLIQENKNAGMQLAA